MRLTPAARAILCLALIMLVIAGAVSISPWIFLGLLLVFLLL